MVTAHSHKKPFGHAARAPRPMSSDSDVVVLALVTAQALEGQGDVGGAARWLRRAAWQAKSDGQARRAMHLARAAADLANAPARSLESASLSSERPSRHSFLRTTRRGEPRQRGAEHRVHALNARYAPHSASPPPARASVWQVMLTLMGVAG
jgi:hypothetical protein